MLFRIRRLATDSANQGPIRVLVSIQDVSIRRIGSLRRVVGAQLRLYLGMDAG